MHDDHDDDPDWEGVEMHTLPDGTRHLTLTLTVHPRPPWWRSGAMWRRHRVEGLLLFCYVSWVVAGVFVWGLQPLYLVTAVVMIGLLFAAIARSISAYRIGFAMGIAAVPLAMQQKSPRLAAELIDRSSELWDPPPASVAHTMEVERLERDVNRGTL